MTGEEYMRLAIEEAKKGDGFVTPNPMVGAVIVRDGRVISTGYHPRCGQLHAERTAIQNCREDLTGAELYVTLEPCCHYGRTPPCTEAILESGITKVVVGSRDPNPLVAGKGIDILRSHGITVVTGVCEDECLKLNEVFFHYIITRRPFIVMKYAMTADGKIATYTGESKWITGEAARHHVQKSRHRYTGIMAGIGTVLKDNPMLNCRLPGKKNPVRIICDSRLRTPLSSRIVTTADEIPAIIATVNKDTERHRLYEAKGCKILVTEETGEHINLNDLSLKLGAENIDSILLEGGGELNFSALKAGIVNKVQAYIAPKIFGGSRAKSPVEGSGIELPSDAFALTNGNITSIGEDFLIEWEVKKCLREL